MVCSVNLMTISSSKCNSQTRQVESNSLSALGILFFHKASFVASFGGRKRDFFSGLLGYPLLQPGTKQCSIVSEPKILHINTLVKLYNNFRIYEIRYLYFYIVTVLTYGKKLEWKISKFKRQIDQPTDKQFVFHQTSQCTKIHGCTNSRNYFLEFLKE